MNLYAEPLNILEEVRGNEKSEMTEFQLSFLCGLIKEKLPKKVLEIGVAAGSTSTVILNCLSKVSQDAVMYSVDLSEQYYRDSSKMTGYMIEEAKQFIPNVCKHKLLLGKYTPEFLEEIGKNIDFLIIDTVHVLPGEILDFLAVFPYLTDDAVVVLHDVILHHENIECPKEAFATKVLLDVVTGKKIFMEDRESYAGYPNIGAFQLNEDTKKYIWDVFSSLTMNWEYVPTDKELSIYINWYEKYYEKKYIELFEKAIRLNEHSHERRQKKREQGQLLMRQFHEMLRQNEKKILIYGAGSCGKGMLAYMDLLGIRVDGFVISDSEQMQPIKGHQVYKVSDIPYNKEDCVIVLALEKQYHDIVRKHLDGYDKVFPVESDGYEEFCTYIFEII